VPSRSLDFDVFDADNHMYETKEALTKHVPDQYKGVIDYVEVNGRTKIVVDGTITEYIPNPTFDVIAKPGAQEEYFKRGNPEGKSYREIIGEPMRAIPAFREPGPRVELMDELGIDRALMFPTLASLVEERLRNDVRTTHAIIHALNQWMLETWTYDYKGRIFPTPVITLPIVERAIEELEWVVERGAKVVLRSKSPDGVEQEVWGFLLVHWAIRELIHTAALNADIDPDRVSFVRTLRPARRTVTEQAAFSP